MKVIVNGTPNIEKLANVLEEIFIKLGVQQENKQEEQKAG
jgi:hypothetical protein